jgi:hypothetical protein
MSTDPNMVTPEAAEFLTIMLEEIRLPDQWDVSGFWLDSAQQLAQFLADHRGKVSLADAAMLTGIGGMLVVMAKREVEAFAAAGGWLRDNGGAV